MKIFSVGPIFRGTKPVQALPVGGMKWNEYQEMRRGAGAGTLKCGRAAGGKAAGLPFPDQGSSAFIIFGGDKTQAGARPEAVSGGNPRGGTVAKRIRSSPDG